MKKFKKVLLTIVGTILGLIVLLLIFVFLGSGGVKTAAEDVLSQMKDGQYQEVFTASPLSQEMSYDNFLTAMGVGTDVDISKAELLAWTERGFENSEKYIVGNFKMPNGTEQILTFRFVEDKEADILVWMGVTPGGPDGD